MLGSNDVGHALIIRIQGIRISLLHLLHALHTLSVRVLSPGYHCFSQHVVLHQVEVVVKLPLSVLIQEVLSSNKPDSLENFHSEGLPSDSTDHIDCVLFLADVVPPHEKDVSSFIDVMIVSHSPGQSLESLVEISVKLLLQSGLFCNLLSKVFCLGIMSSLFKFSLLL